MKIEIGQVYKTNEGGSVTVINYIHADVYTNLTTRRIA